MLINKFQTILNKDKQKKIEKILQTRCVQINIFLSSLEII